MNKGTKIGLLATLATIGVGVVWSMRLKYTAEDVGPLKEPLEDDYISISDQRIKTTQTSNESKKEQYQKDLKRFGTTQGVIDVSNDELEKVKKKRRTKKMVIQGRQITRKALPKTIKNIHHQQPTKYSAFYKWLLSHFNKTQITITNTSDQARVISLWGMNKGASISPPKVTDVEDHQIKQTIEVPSDFGVGRQPQGMAINPANGFTYVANQLSNNVSVMSSKGELITLIELEPSLIPGFNSPVAIAINTVKESPNYGKVYVAGSVSNTVSVIDLNHQVTQTIPTGVRPLDIAFNPVNHQLYVVNLFSNDLTVIDSETETVNTTLSVGSNPLGVGIDLENGAIYVANSSDDSVSVFDASHQLITTINSVGTVPVSVCYHPINKEIYVVAAGSNLIYPIDTRTQNLLSPIPTGNGPYKCVFHPGNNYLYVGNIADNTFTIIAPDKSIRATISKGSIYYGFVIDPMSHHLFISDPTLDRVNLMGYALQSSSITISEDYAHKAQNFLYNPGIVKHTKWVLSGAERFKVLHHQKHTPTGSTITTPISFEHYKSPQNFLNVSELTALEGSIIDGKNSWIFKIAARQTITLMVYFKQFEFYKTALSKDQSSPVVDQATHHINHSKNQFK